MKPLAELINLYIIRNENGFVKHFQEKNPKNNKKMCFSLGFKKESEEEFFEPSQTLQASQSAGILMDSTRAVFSRFGNDKNASGCLFTGIDPKFS